MSAQTGICWINERDLATDFSFSVVGLSGWPGNLGTAPRNTNIQTGPEMPGGIFDPRLLMRQPGKATITGILMGTSVSNAETLLDALRGLTGQGEVMVRTAYATDRYCLAMLDGIEGTPFNAPVLDGVVNLTLSFTVKDGVAWRTVPDGIALSTTRVACPIGSAESKPVLLIHGGGVAFTNPVVTVRNAAGDSVQTMGFTFSGGANDVLRVDSARSQLSKIASGTITDGLAAGYWVSGDFPLLRPADGWVEDSAYPTVELSSDTGTAQGLITYTRRFV